MQLLYKLAVILVLSTAVSKALEQETGTVIGELPDLAGHQIQGTLIALDENTLFIRNFHFDGQGPAVYVYVYLRNTTADPTGNGYFINWRSSGSDGRLSQRYSGQNVTISLLDRPDDDRPSLTVSDIGNFSIWCSQFEVFFSLLEIPGGLEINPAPPAIEYEFCAQLTSNYQVSWTINAIENIGMFQLCSCITSDQYMAFGISGSNTSTNMVGADVVVAWVDNGVANAVDYYLTSRQQCRGGNGVCPDDLIAANGGGSQDIFDISGRTINGQTCVQYSRNLTTDDSEFDRPILDNQSQFVAWAYGPRAVEEGLQDLALFHTEWPRNGENVEINFGAAPTGIRQCNQPPQCIMEETVCGYTGLTIAANTETIFRVRIGPSGGPRGYQSITGLSGWGIAYYIDDTLIPVLKLKRNVTYIFIVEAGNDPNDGPRFHPFYITNSEDGGILLDTEEQRMSKNEVVYAGFDVATNTPLAAGRYCSHVETAYSGAVAEDCDRNLQDYLDTLTVTCEGEESEIAVLTWTPDENTPDVVYYQCANHFHLGWRIELSDVSTDEDVTEESGNLECVDICPVAGAGWVSALRPFVNGTTVALIWEPNQGTGGTNYEIQYRLRNTDSVDPTFNASFITADTVEDVTTYTIQGLLQPDTDYEVRVCLIEEPDNCGDCLLCVQTGNDPDDVIIPTRTITATSTSTDTTTLGSATSTPEATGSPGDNDNTNDESGGTVTSGQSFMSLILVAVLSIKITTVLLM